MTKQPPNVFGGDVMVTGNDVGADVLLVGTIDADGHDVLFLAGSKKSRIVCVNEVF